LAIIAKGRKPEECYLDGEFTTKLVNILGGLSRATSPDLMRNDPKFLIDSDESFLSVLETYPEIYSNTDDVPSLPTSRSAITFLEYYSGKLSIENITDLLANSDEPITLARYLIANKLLSFSEAWSVLIDSKIDYNWWFKQFELPKLSISREYGPHHKFSTLPISGEYGPHHKFSALPISGESGPRYKFPIDHIIFGGGFPEEYTLLVDNDSLRITVFGLPEFDSLVNYLLKIAKVIWNISGRLNVVQTHDKLIVQAENRDVEIPDIDLADRNLILEAIRNNSENFNYGDELVFRLSGQLCIGELEIRTFEENTRKNRFHLSGNTGTRYSVLRESIVGIVTSTVIEGNS
jgi:hypothetical protein